MKFGELLHCNMGGHEWLVMFVAPATLDTNVFYGFIIKGSTFSMKRIKTFVLLGWERR